MTINNGVEEMIEDIYTSVPVNKTAALVTNQSGCEDNIFIDQEERRKDLCRRQAELENKITNLKNDLGLYKKQKNGDPLPKYILKDKRYAELCRFRSEVSEICEELKGTRAKVKEIRKMQQNTFERKFIEFTKEKYPGVFEDIKKMVHDDLQSR